VPTASNQTLLAPAAKFDASGTRYHPLLFHMLDTAAVSLALWDSVVSARVRQLIGDGLQLDGDQARSWAALVCALHDLGKASPSFQLKDKGAPGRLTSAGVPTGVPAKDPGHGLVTTVQLERLLRARGLNPRSSVHLASIAGGHHGVFPLWRIGEGQGSQIGEQDPSCREAWDSVRQGLYEAVWEALEVSVLPGGHLTNAGTMALAGLVTVADWIASNELLFPWALSVPGEALPDPHSYWHDRALQAAATALDHLRWRLPPLKSPGGFRDLFPRADRPRPLQQAVQDVSASAPPECLIVEAPTGEGKTEAALLWMLQWARRGTPGLYVAMPTQATSNQLHGRLKEFLARLFADQDANVVIPLMLVHGGADLAGDSVFTPSGIHGDEGPDTVTVQAAEWFLPSKRSLLAPFGVGTIDQALLAALRVKHMFVRLFALAGKPVIIDEVHAYDTYMSAILERLLEWLGALGSPVALLSATLPVARRRELLDAYARGAADRDGSAASASSANELRRMGPGLTYLTTQGVHWRAVEVRPEAVRRLRLERINDDPIAVADRLARYLAQGGCGAVVCNTVARAQETYAVLRERFGRDVCRLFHSRFLRGDRRCIERRCLEEFGPPTDRGVRPALAILVATQVIEQSLDLDFDILVTDLAPVDLLIQRAGRLQRHARPERPVSGEPTLVLRWPSGVPPAIDRGTLAIYSEHVLLRTWAAIRTRDGIAVPDDVPELVDYVYADADEGPPPDLVNPLQIRWQQTWTELQASRLGRLDQARDRRLPSPTGPRRPPSDFQRAYDDEDDLVLDGALRGVTRLAAPTIDLVLLRAGDPLIAEVSRGAEPLPRKLVGELVLRSVGISSQRFVAAMRDMEVPSRFAATPGLRRHRLLVLDASDCAVIGAHRLRLDPELGVVVEPAQREGNGPAWEAIDADA